MKESTQSLLTETKKLAGELKRLEAMEAGAQATIVQATDEDITAPDVQKRITEARLTLALVSARRSKLRPPLSVAHNLLREQLKAETDAWNNSVVAARKAKEAEIVRANLPFYENNEREFRRHFNFDAVPAMYHFRRAFAEVPRYENPAQADLARDAGLLIAHIERWSKKLGLS
jgi:hypothetical protein